MKSNLKIKLYLNKLGVLKTFVLNHPYSELWEQYEKLLDLKEGEFPSEENFNEFVKKNQISIPNIDDTGYGLIVLPW